MKKVKFLTTSAGDYGNAFAGDEKEVNDSLAAQLEEKGLVKVVGSAGKDVEPAETKTPVSTPTLNVRDETGKKAPVKVASAKTSKKK